MGAFFNISHRAKNLFLIGFIFMYPISRLLGYASLTFRRSSRSRSELSFNWNSWFEKLLSGSKLSLHTGLFQSTLLKAYESKK